MTQGEKVCALCYTSTGVLSSSDVSEGGGGGGGAVDTSRKGKNKLTVSVSRRDATNSSVAVSRDPHLNV